MARKSILSLVFLVSLAGLLAGGCVSQEKYNALKLDRDRYAEQLGQAQVEASSASKEAEAYKNQLASLGQNGTGQSAMILNLTNQNNDLQRQLDDLNRKYSDAGNRTAPSDQPPDL